ncbi:hypothetical protein PIB30_039318 [Stylosanthes scabra]|uniref:PRONE domain-containing protein n=1 Tax=Stylosanthes scabra TaxID=79078 RepID=A0ABU6QET3_9FABA|nr:hypothetical protein [Stylosanthes scabra]
MAQDTLDNFRDQCEFWYVKKTDEKADDKTSNQRKNDKWWLPTVKVSPTGLSELALKWIQCQKDSVNQVLKAAMAINSQVLAEMAIPENYIESLPKNGRESLGESVYKSITDDIFEPGLFLQTMDMSTEHKVLDLKNRIEASIVIWKRKMNNKDSKWSSAVSIEKRELFEERAETILMLIKQNYPGLPQSQLDISKIQYNKDVGHAILESYSRVIESLAHTVMSRIEDVLYADSLANNLSVSVSRRRFSRVSSSAREERSPKAEEEETGTSQPSAETPTASMTLSDFMGWGAPKEGSDAVKTSEDLDESLATTPKRAYYEDKLENLTSNKSPISRD